MVWLSKLFAVRKTQNLRLPAAQQRQIAAWRELPVPDLNRSHYRSRYVLVDVATAGPDWKTGALKSIGALALVDGLIHFNDALHAAMANEAVADRAQSAPVAQAPQGQQPGGEQRAEALLSFLGFVGKAPLVAFHASFAARRIERAMAESLGIELSLPWIDLAWVLASLFREVGDTNVRLDTWLDHFGVDSIQRHHPVSDAYATAQVLQITLAHAARKGVETPVGLFELEKAHRHLYQSG